MDITPAEVDDVQAAFGANVRGLLPKWDEIPEEFKRSSNEWCRLVTTWFFSGLSGAVFTPKDGVDKQAALRHVQACMGSFEPKHEHKAAGCAYLLSEFFERVEYGGHICGEPREAKKRKARRKRR